MKNKKYIGKYESFYTVKINESEKSMWRASRSGVPYWKLISKDKSSVLVRNKKQEKINKIKGQ